MRADCNTKKAQFRYIKDYDEHVRFEQRFGAGDYVLVERPHKCHPLQTARITRDCKLLPCCTGLCRVISGGPKYAMVDQDCIRNIVSTTRLTRVVKKGRPKMKSSLTQGKTRTPTLYGKRSSKREEAPALWGESSDMRTDLQGHIILSDSTATGPWTMWLNVPPTSSTTSERHIGACYENFNTNQNLHGKKKPKWGKAFT